jgi:hypothetical protein
VGHVHLLMIDRVTSYLHLGAGVLLGLVLAASLVNKVRGRAAVRAFADALAGLRFASGRVALPLALFIIGVEASAGALLAYPATYLGGLLSVTALMATYAVAVAVVLRRDVRAPCGCFGSAGDRPLGYPQLVRNLLLVAVGIVGVATGAQSDHPLHPGGVVVTIAGTTLAAIVVIRLDDLVDLLAPPTTTRGRGPSSVAP